MYLLYLPLMCLSVVLDSVDLFAETSVTLQFAGTFQYFPVNCFMSQSVLVHYLKSLRNLKYIIVAICHLHQHAQGDDQLYHHSRKQQKFKILYSFSISLFLVTKPNNSFHFLEMVFIFFECFKAEFTHQSVLVLCINVIFAFLTNFSCYNPTDTTKRTFFLMAVFRYLFPYLKICNQLLSIKPD